MSCFKVRQHKHFLSLEFLVPEAGNAFGLDVARELTEIQKAYARKSPRVVVVFSGHRSIFCSGGNLSDYRKLKNKAAGLKINREIQRHLQYFARWPAVKLAVVEGDVLGGGMEWLARFDFRWSTPYAYFAFWQRRIGLSPGWGGGQAWASKIGEASLRSLLQEARLLSAEQAERRQLIDRIFSSWKIREAVSLWAEALNGDATAKLGRWSVAREAAIFSSLWQAPEHQAALVKWRPGKKT